MKLFTLAPSISISPPFIPLFSCSAILGFFTGFPTHGSGSSSPIQLSNPSLIVPRGQICSPSVSLGSSPGSQVVHTPPPPLSGGGARDRQYHRVEAMVLRLLARHNL